ncbi:NAD(P)/FAD-dependent oxidoreductase [Sphingomicrobium aestuariivivum]|uniref:NAD(P)/FAD-dependent oxidoreductase n=1 Tax=Sphingomicrobium aestuariivivum TaxID=1582356 RepID=UPI001FD6CF4F|nr:FAD-dependent oxidoreductase [Sphingomicrobium aestuariivivum]MCJ8190185.1 FAD-binding oxidoreductase [Sphingomicrobium aestuariivivum]
MSEENASDVLIVGAGIAGLALGAHLARAGLSVRVLEAEERPGYHATGRSAAFWLESYGGAAVMPLTAASRGFLDQPPANFSARGFLKPRGAIHLARGGDEAAFDALPPGTATERLGPERLRTMIPGLREDWSLGLAEPSCREIDVAGLHQAYAASLARAGGTVTCGARVADGRIEDGRWTVRTEDGRVFHARDLVNAAGAWVDEVAGACGIAPLGFTPMRRTMVQLRIEREGVADLPLVSDARGTFYFRGEGTDSVWLSPHDETASTPCDAAPEELAVAEAIARLEEVVDWKIAAVTRKWAGLRTFAPDRLPVIGRDPGCPSFFWYAGQGGTGIQTQPAAAALARALFLGKAPTGTAKGLTARAFLPERFR